MSQKVTLDDVARLSGVSRATASRAINGRPGVKADIRDRVMLIADNLGFRPNRAAKNLASGMTSVIGLVIPSQDLRIDPYGAALTHAVGRAALGRDFGLMLHLAADEPGQTVNHILRDGFIDGLLISSVAIGPRWVDELFDASLPTVLIGGHPTRTDLLRVDVENLESAAAAVTHLFEQGCQNVGCITGPLDRADARARLAGFELAHERAGREISPAHVVHGNFSREHGAAAAALLYDAGVDGIFASNDEMAMGALWKGVHRGIRAPRDVKIVGFDGLAGGEFIEPSLTSMVQPFDQLAVNAVDLLIALVGGATDLESVLLAPELLKGGSTEIPTI